MTRSDEYRNHAAYAMERAESATSEDMRAEWLRLAGKWLDMVPQSERSAGEKFSKALRHNGTGQPDSDASH